MLELLFHIFLRMEQYNILIPIDNAITTTALNKVSSDTGFSSFSSKASTVPSLSSKLGFKLYLSLNLFATGPPIKHPAINP